MKLKVLNVCVRTDELTINLSTWLVEMMMAAPELVSCPSESK